MFQAGVMPAGSGKCAFATGGALRLAPRRAAPSRVAVAAPVVAELERLRLHNLSPEKGSRPAKSRKGRGHSAGQGGSCGRGMRGQLANSPGIRTGFEGGQMPLYRRLPKLRGIAGGMPAGRKTHVVVNLADLSAAVAAGKLDVNAELTLATLKEARLVNASGAERKLPLKVLGEGDLTQPLKVKANAFSASAREKLAAAGGAAIDDAGKAKWTRALGERRKAAAEAAAPPTPKGKGGASKK